MYAMLFLAAVLRDHGVCAVGRQLNWKKFLSRIDQQGETEAADLSVESSVEEQDQPIETTQKTTLTPVWPRNTVGPTTPTTTFLFYTTSGPPLPPTSTPTTSTKPLFQNMRTTSPMPTAIEEAEWEAEVGTGGRILLQILFGIAYYYLIVRHYRKLMPSNTPTIEAIALQEMSEISATIEGVTWPNLFHSFCCSGPRAAHTFDAVGIMDYWAGLLLMTFFPCCTLCYAASFTELHPLLGGKKRNPFMALIFTCFCSCCVIAQDAETLDLLTNEMTGFVSITQGYRQVLRGARHHHGGGQA